MRLGPLQLCSNLFLSPLAGYTNLPFRLVVRELGGVGLCTTDLVNARSLLEQRPKALKLIETTAADAPLALAMGPPQRLWRWLPCFLPPPWSCAGCADALMAVSRPIEFPTALAAQAVPAWAHPHPRLYNFSQPG